MPYAYGATIKHVFDTDHLEIYLTFRHQMLRSSDYTADPVVYDVFPPLANWLVEADGVAVDAVDNEWIDEYTLLITSDPVATRPAQVKVEYDGPDAGLCFRWGKQIEPFGPIFSYDQNWYENPSYVDRGDPDAADFESADIVKDAAWHDMDLSAIVPAGAKAVSISLYIIASGSGRILRFRKNGNVNILAISGTMTQVANVAIFTDCVVSLDENRMIEYYASALTFLGIQIVIKGWWV